MSQAELKTARYLKDVALPVLSLDELPTHILAYGSNDLHGWKFFMSGDYDTCVSAVVMAKGGRILPEEWARQSNGQRSPALWALDNSLLSRARFVRAKTEGGDWVSLQEYEQKLHIQFVKGEEEEWR